MARIRSAIFAGSRRRNGGTGIGSGMTFRLSGRGPDVGRSRSGRKRIQPVPQTPDVDTVALVFVLRAARGWDGATIRAIGGGIAVQHPDLRLRRDEADSTRLWGSGDCTADDLDGALSHGREPTDEMASACPPDVAVEEVVAMDDERQLVWRAKP